jgi:hypothetical protein
VRHQILGRAPLLGKVAMVELLLRHHSLANTARHWAEGAGAGAALATRIPGRRGMRSIQLAAVRILDTLLYPVPSATTALSPASDLRCRADARQRTL